MSTLEYISNIEDDPYLGIYNKIDIDQRPPVEIPTMTRKHLCRLFRKLGFRRGAEIGVERGHYSACICKCNPGIELYSIDPWKAYGGYRDHVSQSKLDAFYGETKERLSVCKNWGCKVHIVRKFSMEAVKDFEDGGLDFVYIDANHDFIHVAEDIWYWSKKVRKDGIVAGHDFVRRKGFICHVKDVVPAYCYSQGIRPWFVLRGEKTPSWFYVK